MGIALVSEEQEQVGSSTQVARRSGRLARLNHDLEVITVALLHSGSTSAG